MKKYIVYLFIMFTLPLQAQQPGKVAKTHFADPAIQINTPWFQKGRAFTTYTEMMEYIEKQIAPHSQTASLSYIGETQKGTRIPAVRIVKKGNGEKVKVLFLGKIHGDEPASTEGCLYLLDQLLNTPDMAYLLDKLDITIIPMVNIDGGSHLSRQTANSLDLNRDMSKLETSEAVALRNFYNEYAPQVVIDFHEFQPVRADYGYISDENITNSFDAMFLYSGNLNIPAELRELTGDLFVGNAKKRNGQTEFTSPRLLHHDPPVWRSHIQCRRYQSPVNRQCICSGKLSIHINGNKGSTFRKTITEKKSIYHLHTGRIIP